MARWAVDMIVLNEEDYIEQALTSVYDFAAEINIVHGAYEGYKGATEEGLSIDRTKEIIAAFPDPGKKIVLNNYGWAKGGQQEMRNKYLSMNSPETEWILVLDADEAYRIDQLAYLNDSMVGGEYNREIVSILNDQFWFWGDTNTICEINEEIFNAKQVVAGEQIFYDKRDRFTFNGRYQERIFKNLPGLKYGSHWNVQDAQGRYLYADIFYQYKRIYTNSHNLRRFHYGCLKDYSAHANRKQFYGKRDDMSYIEKTNDPEKLKEYINNSHYFRWLIGGDSLLAETHKHMYVQEFEYEHPESMRKHKWFGKKISEFGKLPFKCHWEK